MSTYVHVVYLVVLSVSPPSVFPVTVVRAYVCLCTYWYAEIVFFLLLILIFQILTAVRVVKYYYSIPDFEVC